MPTEFPGSFATVRFTDADEFADVRRGDWWPSNTNDYAEFRAWIAQLVDVHGDLIVEARDEDPASDRVHRAVLVRTPEVPWSSVNDLPDLDDALKQVDVIVIDDSDGLTVLSYPRTGVAVAAFYQHLIDRHAVGRGYGTVAMHDDTRALTIDRNTTTAAASSAGPASPLRWEARDLCGDIRVSEGTVTITVDGHTLVGIDLTAGHVIVWPDGEVAHTVEHFARHPQQDGPTLNTAQRCGDSVWFRTHLPARIGSHDVIETFGWQPGVQGRTRAAAWAITHHPDHGYATHLVKAPDTCTGWILDRGNYDLADLDSARADLLDRAGYRTAPADSAGGVRPSSLGGLVTDPSEVLVEFAEQHQIAVAYLNREWFTGHLDRDLTDDEWARIARHLDRYDEHVSTYVDVNADFAYDVCRRAGIAP